MRAVSQNLQVARSQASSVPYINLRVGQGLYTSRILSLEHTEQPFAGKATIVLRNQDQLVTPLDFRGSLVQIGYGYWVSSLAVEWVQAPPLWVMSQIDYSEEGVSVRKLECLDLWGRIGLETLASGGQDLHGVVDGRLQPGMVVIGNNSGTRARILYTTSTYISVNQVQGPGFTGETIHSELDPSIVMSVFSQVPWGGGPGPGWNGTFTIFQIIQALLSGITSVILDSSDGVVNVQKPVYSVQNGSKVLAVIKDMLGRTATYARVSTDGFIHIGSVDSNTVPVMAYATNTDTFIDTHQRKLVIPTRVLVYNSKPSLTSTSTVTAIAEDPAATAQAGRPIDQIVDLEVQSTPEAISIANSVLRRAQMEAAQGRIVSKMHVGQELWDYISVTDYRTGETYNGWVGEIVRRYEAHKGVYQIEVGLGNLYEGSPAVDPLAPTYTTPNGPGSGNYAPAVGTIYMDNVQDGPSTYGRVRLADLSNGHVLLSSTIQSTSYRTVNDVQLGVIQEAYDFLVAKDYKYGLRMGTNSGASRVDWTSNGLVGLNNHIEQFVVDGNSGIAYTGNRQVRFDSSGINISAQTLKFESSWAVWVPNLSMPNGGRPLSVETPGGVWAQEGLWVNDGRRFGVVSGGSGPFSLIYSTRNLNGTIVDSYIVPQDYARGWLGAFSQRWNTYFNNMNSNNVFTDLTMTTNIQVAQDLYPQTADSGTIGGARRWGSINVVNGNISQIAASSITTTAMLVRAGGSILPETTIPGGSGNIGLPTRSFITGAFHSVYATFEVLPLNDAGETFQTTDAYLGRELRRWAQIYSMRGDFTQEITVGTFSPYTSFGGVGIFPKAANSAYCGSNIRYWERTYSAGIFYRVVGGFHEEDDAGVVNTIHEALRPGTSIEMPAAVQSPDGFYDHGNLMGYLIGAIAQMNRRLEALEA